MNTQNRIERVSLTATVPRQTPKNDFGDQLRSVVGEGIKRTQALFGGFVPGPPAVSAAVSGVSGIIAQSGGALPSAANGYVANPYASTQYTRSAAAGIVPPPVVTSGDPTQQFGMVNDALSRSQEFSVNYLLLQHSIQSESRDFNMATNLMKVRHDSSKAAINNIR